MKPGKLAICVAMALAASSAAARADGKQAFLDANCAQCHSVTSEEIPAMMMNLELDGLGAKRDAAAIADYLRAGAPHPMAWNGTEEDLAAVAEWLSTK